MVKTPAELLAEISVLRALTDEDINRRVDERIQQWVEADTVKRLNEIAYAQIGQAALSILHVKNIDVPRLNSKQDPVTGGPAEENIDILRMSVIEYITMGCDFNTLIQAIRKSPTLQSEWDRFCMMLRLTEGADDGQAE